MASHVAAGAPEALPHFAAMLLQNTPSRWGFGGVSSACETALGVRACLPPGIGEAQWALHELWWFSSEYPYCVRAFK